MAAPPMAPGMTPIAGPAPEACLTAPARPSVMDHRLAIGFSIGSMSLAPKDFPDDRTAFALGELALRYRLTRHLELEGSIAGGRERTSDDMDGDLEVTTAMIAARWRFRPEGAWNWFLTAGLGAAEITRHDATQKERDDAWQPMGMLGIGVEHRWRHLALQGELRGVGLGKVKEEKTTDSTPTAMSTVTTNNRVDIERSGASLTIGLSYYF
jgi:hypothetical protein